MQGSAPRLPAGQTEKRDWAGRETGRFGTSEGDGARRAIARNPAPRRDSRKEKGPGDYPGPWYWWSRRESPLQGALALASASRVRSARPEPRACTRSSLARP